MGKKVFVIAFIVLFTCLNFISFVHATTDENSYAPAENTLITEKAKVLDIISDVSKDDYENQSFEDLKQVVEIEILTGEYKGQILTVDNQLNNHIYYDILLEKGDRVTVAIGEAASDDTLPNIYISGFERDRYELYILIIFIFLLIVIGGFKGVKAVLSLLISIFLILFFMLPFILKGYSPILLSVITAIIVATLTLFIIAGINIKSASAIIGTATGVVAAGIIAYVIGGLANLTGLSNHEASMLMYLPQDISFDYRGILFAGIIIGTLGAVMDIAMSIASAMHEIREIEPDISTRDLITAGINIGRDVMGTMTNTLILAYTGTSIPLMLIFIAYDFPLVEILNMDQIATEIIRSIAGSIGLVLAIPFTAMTCGVIINHSATKKRHERVRRLKEEYQDDLKEMFEKEKRGGLSNEISDHSNIDNQEENTDNQITT